MLPVLYGSVEAEERIQRGDAWGWHEISRSNNQRTRGAAAIPAYLFETVAQLFAGAAETDSQVAVAPRSAALFHSVDN